MGRRAGRRRRPGRAGRDGDRPANAGPPGDSVTGLNNASVAIGSTGWYYDSLRAGAAIGISTANPRSGNGSVLMQSSGGAAKADVTYAPGGALGLLSELTALSYDWFRAEGSTNSSAQSPSIRLFVSDGLRSGFLVWEAVDNGDPAPVTEGEWVTSDAFGGGSGLFWGTGTLPGAAVPRAGLKSIDQWREDLANYSVYAVNSGIGSGWNGNFVGAVDNITFGFNGASTTDNFEVVPEPASVAMGLIADVAGLAEALRRRRLATR